MEISYAVNEDRQMSFFQIPKFLMTNPEFQKMSCEAKFIYGLMLDRLKLSIKNKWVDKDNKTFIIFQNSDIAKMIGCGVKKVINLVKELKHFGLIKTKRVGLTKPNMIYINQFIEKAKDKFEKTFKNNAKNDKNLEKLKNIDGYREIIKENISYSHLLKQYPYDKKRIDEIIEIMVETVTSKKDYLKISNEKIPIELAKNKFLKLDSEDIMYILHSLDNTYSNIKNIKAYLLTVLYNCKNTINNYYKQRVNYDMYGGG